MQQSEMGPNGWSWYALTEDLYIQKMMSYLVKERVAQPKKYKAAHHSGQDRSRFIS